MSEVSLGWLILDLPKRKAISLVRAWPASWKGSSGAQGLCRDLYIWTFIKVMTSWMLRESWTGVLALHWFRGTLMGSTNLLFMSLSELQGPPPKGNGSIGGP